MDGLYMFALEDTDMLSPKAKAIFAKKKASVGKPTFGGSSLKRKGKPKESAAEEAKEKRMGME